MDANISTMDKMGKGMEQWMGNGSWKNGGIAGSFGMMWTEVL